MNCQDVFKHWDKFLSGDCPEQQEKQIEEHIKQCESCSVAFAKVFDEQQPAIKITNNTTFDEVNIKKQRQILKKARWKQRISTAFSLLGILVILTIAGSILSNLYFLTGEKSKVDRADEVLTVMTEMTSPNMSLHGRSANTLPYFRTKIETQITKQLGNDFSYPIGKLKANLLFSMLDVERNWDRSSGLDVKMNFLNPHYAGFVEDNKKWNEDSWRHLAKVKDGTVAEVAISLDKTYSVEDAQQLLTGDFDIVWLAIDTGVEKDNYGDVNPYVSQMDSLWGLPTVPNSNVLSGIWDKRPSDYERTEEKKWFGKVVNESYSYEILEPSEETFYNGLNFLKENKRWAKAYPSYYTGNSFFDELERIEQYVTKNGVKVYGMVITGPTEEILKLKDKQEVQYISVGEIDWWNWGNSNFSGTMNY